MLQKVLCQILLRKFQYLVQHVRLSSFKKSGTDVFSFSVFFFLRLRFIVDLIREILLTFLVVEKSCFSFFNRFNQPYFNFEPKIIVHSIHKSITWYE